MPRANMPPQYVEIDHLLNGDLEAWSLSTVPDGWTLTGGANGTVNKDTVSVFSQGASARFDKTASGAIYIVQTPHKPLKPGFWYLLKGAVLAGTTSPLGTVSLRLVNVTQSQSVNTSGNWIAGLTTTWRTSAGLKFISGKVWTQIPASFSEGDAYELRAGMFSAGTSLSGWADFMTMIGPYVRPIHEVGLSGLTTALHEQRQILATLRSPAGVEIDVTRRIALDGLGNITEGAEEEILQITHGDMTLRLDDRDGMLRGLFYDSAPADRWELIVLTETGRASGLKWDRLFAGVLDLPWSVSHNPHEQETQVQAFSYTKVLDNIRATGIGRTVVGRTMTITAGARAATANSTSNLIRGDQIRVASGASEETMIVDRVTGATTFTVLNPAQNSFTGAGMSLDTYFHREKTAGFLADLVLDAASVPSRSISLGSDLAAYPLPQPIAANGLGIKTHPESLVPQAGNITVTYQASEETKRKVASSPTVGFSAGATSNVPQGDWRPYLTSEPGTIKESTNGGNFDNGSMAWDHTGGHVYHTQTQNSGFPAFLNTVHLYKDGVDVGPMGAGIADPDTVDRYGMDFDPVNGRCWYSVQNTAGGKNFGYYDGSHHSVSSSFTAQIRCCRPMNRLFVLDLSTYAISLYDLTTLAIVGTAQAADGIVFLWTLRAWSTFFGFMVQRSDGTYLAIYDQASLRLLAVHKVSTKPPYYPALMTVFTLPGSARDVAIGYAGEEWFLVSQKLDGVVPYADFTGLSCSGAMKELATASLAYFGCDRYGTAFLTQRSSAIGSAAALEISQAPLERMSRPIWEFYRTGVRVTARDANANDIIALQGTDGGSPKLLEINSPLVSTQGMADMIARFYAVYLNRSVKQEDIRIDEPEEPVRVLDVVLFEDRKWLVTQVESNPREREQRLRLFEVAA